MRANGLLGDAAQNYKLANDGAASFTVAASSSAGGAGTDGGTGSNAGSADKNGKGNKGKNSGGNSPTRATAPALPPGSLPPP